VFTLEVEVFGLERLRKKLAPETYEGELLAEPWRAAMEGIGVIAQNLAIQAAPIGSGRKAGRTVALMFHKVQAKPMPMWVRIGTTAAAAEPRGERSRVRRGKWRYPYSYPARLNYDPASPIRGWFDQAMKKAVYAAQEVLEVAAKKIEDNWAK
jgi:hypothetical protein